MCALVPDTCTFVEEVACLPGYGPVYLVKFQYVPPLPTDVLYVAMPDEL